MHFDQIWNPKYLGDKKILGPEVLCKNQSHGDLSIAHIFCVIRAISSDPGEYLIVFLTFWKTLPFLLINKKSQLSHQRDIFKELYWFSMFLVVSFLASQRPRPQLLHGSRSKVPVFLLVALYDLNNQPSYPENKSDSTNRIIIMRFKRVKIHCGGVIASSKRVTVIF